MSGMKKEKGNTIMNCRICNGDRWDTIRTGPIRVGKHGNLSVKDYPITRCLSCGVDYLAMATVDYEANDYRQLVDGGADLSHFQAVHDKEQGEKVAILGWDRLRNVIIADIGCGGGSFLDAALGYARETIAIEPAQAFSSYLKSKGHDYFPYCHNALTVFKEMVDIATCFSVIEHLEDPKTTLQEIRSLLKPGAKLLVSTPNRDDWLLQLIPDVYESFFYRQVHRWYWDAASLAALGRAAGFNKTTTFYRHRFDLSNLIGWIRDQRPTGLGKIAIPPTLDACFTSCSESNGKADYLYAWMEK